MIRYNLRTLLIVLALGLVGSLVYVAYQAQRALIESHTMVMGRATTHLVRDYVRQHHRWPKSWEDLRSIQPPAPFDQSGRFIDTAQTRVVIEFDVKLRDVTTLSAEDFRAIRPRGYAPADYQEYWEIDSLLEACRSAVSEETR